MTDFLKAYLDTPKTTLLGGKGFLQTFADGDPDPQGGEGNEGDKGAGNGNPSTNSLEDLLKNDPDFKKQYEDKIKENLSQRMKKFEGVDLEEYKRLKAEEDKKKQENMTEAEKLKAELDSYKAKTDALEAKERDLAIKEKALTDGLDAKLIAKLIDPSSIKRAEEGDGFTGIEEAIEAVKEEFPQLFQSTEGNEPESKKMGASYKLPTQKGNPDHKTKGYDAGKARAMARHGKQE